MAKGYLVAKVGLRRGRRWMVRGPCMECSNECGSLLCGEQVQVGALKSLSLVDCGDHKSDHSPGRGKKPTQ